MQEIIKIGLVDDQELIRVGLKSVIDNWEDTQVIFESGNGFSVCNTLSQIEELPQVMLVDLSLPPIDDIPCSGIDLTVELCLKFPELKIIILTIQDDPITMSTLIEKGAHGFLSKSCSPEELHNAIKAVMTQGSYINTQTLQALQLRLTSKSSNSPTNLNSNGELSSREKQILELICQQLTAEEIGERLFISPKTVNGHRNNLLQKTGSRNITGLVMYAIQHGIAVPN